MKKKIAIIGASYLQMPLVLKAKELGLEIHCFAWEKGAVCKPFVDFFYPISTVEKEKIFEICKAVKIDGITSIASDIAVPTINFISNELGLVGNNYSDSNAFTNKYLMREIFTQNRVTSPLFFKCSNKDLKQDLDSLTLPLIVKPVDRSGSLGVQKIDKLNKLKSAIETAQSVSLINECIVEEFVEGVEVSVESISWEGKHYILAITDKETTGSPYFVELAHHQPSLLPYDIQKKIIQMTQNALNALNIKFGASHSEFKITYEGNVYAIEVGARMGGDFIGSDLVYLSTGYDFLKGTINVALGHFEEPKLTYKGYSGVYFLCSERKQLKEVIENNTLKQIVKAEITKEAITPIQCSADRSGYLIYYDIKKLVI